jgi:hypothetical protein
VGAALVAAATTGTAAEAPTDLGDRDYRDPITLDRGAVDGVGCGAATDAFDNSIEKTIRWRRPDLVIHLLLVLFNFGHGTLTHGFLLVGDAAAPIQGAAACAVGSSVKLLI